VKGRRTIRILFVDGPNLNVLGEREPSVYGKETLADIRQAVTAAARAEGATVAFFQSNHEGEIVERLQAAKRNFDGVAINPAAYTHTSVAVRDALLYSGLPAVEVHLSNPAGREGFRKVSFIEDVVVGRICGFGGYGYTLALLALLRHLRREGDRGRA
jgi:3-dehydroquinate dehydratase-2